MNCLVCYDDVVPAKFVGCPIKECTSAICYACAEEMLDFVLQEKVMFMCPVKECSTHYTLSKIPKNLVPKYQKVCCEYLLQTTQKEIEAKKDYKTIVEKIRTDKIKFIQENTYPAIAHIISITYTKEINKVNRGNANVMNALENNKRCVGFLCKGLMILGKSGRDDEARWSCGKCMKEYCKACEKEATPNHVCKKEDVESVAIVSSMVKCPVCKLPVVKSHGCNNITCAVCRTNFDYITGKPSQAGNHTNDAPIKMREYDSIFKVYGKDYAGDVAILDLLVKVDEALPIQHSMKPIIAALERTPDALALITKRYTNYLERCIETKQYQSKIDKIRILHDSGKLTEESLRVIVEEM